MKRLVTKQLLLGGVLLGGLGYLGYVLYSPVTFIVLMLSMEPSREEIIRLPSPSGKVDAIVCEVNGGATTSFSYDVYLAEPGERLTKGADRVANFYAALRNRQSSGVNLRWDGPDKLVVEYLDAQHAEVFRPSMRGAWGTVQVAARNGVDDASAPVGYMAMHLPTKKQNCF